MQPTIFSKKLRKRTQDIDFFSKFAGLKVPVKQNNGLQIIICIPTNWRST